MAANAAYVRIYKAFAPAYKAGCGFLLQLATLPEGGQDDPMFYRNRPPFPNNGIYLTILWLMVANIVVGALLALFGERLLDSPAASQFGTGLMLVAGALYFFFRWLGVREARRRLQDSPDPQSQDTPQDRDQDQPPSRGRH